MLIGRRFRLKVDILGIDSSGDKRVAVTIPAGEIVRVLSDPRPGDRPMVDVLWVDLTFTLTVFVEDLKRRGEEI